MCGPAIVAMSAASCGMSTLCSVVLRSVQMGSSCSSSTSPHARRLSEPWLVPSPMTRPNAVAHRLSLMIESRKLRHYSIAWLVIVLAPISSCFSRRTIRSTSGRAANIGDMQLACLQSVTL